jgi:hypothetical protein
MKRTDMKEMMTAAELPRRDSYEDASIRVETAFSGVLGAMRKEHRDRSTPDEYVRIILASIEFFGSMLKVCREQTGEISPEDRELLRSILESGSLNSGAEERVRTVINGSLVSDISIALNEYQEWTSILENNMDKFSGETRERVISGAEERRRFLEEQLAFWGKTERAAS